MINIDKKLKISNLKITSIAFFPSMKVKICQEVSKKVEFPSHGALYNTLPHA